MTIDRLRLGVGITAIALVPATAQAQHLMPAPTPNADALAAQMRILGDNPRDVTALLRASELSIRLADTPAALAFLARAQAVDPSNPRILAGRASALVVLERPAEALRLYDQAERAGVAIDPYLGQRGLAYDLTGQPALAQRDYRRALVAGADDEVTRRLALSLGISGKRTDALALLDPLLRRNDRAAWRAWSFVLAMTDDQVEARKIASGMMVGGAALAPFLARLPELAAADRAFAVHFGQLSPTPTRLADARGASAPAAIVSQRAPVELASRAPTPIAPTPPRSVAQSVPIPVPSTTPVRTASAVPIPTPSVSSQTTSSMPIPVPSTLTAQPNVVRASSSIVESTRPLVTAPARPPATAAATPVITTTQSVPIEVVTLPVRRPTPTPPPVPAPPVQPAAARPAPVVRTPEVARRNTQMLASIIDTIDVPASELDVAPARPAAVKPVASKRPAEPVVNPADTRKATADKKAADGKALADAKAAVDKKRTAEARKAADAKKAAEAKKPDPAKAEPQRWWVQVAGGANEDDLGKDWKRVAAKSAALKGKGAYTTPLRATNRLLTGPFKSQEEAMALVNALKKDGTSAFAWQSPAGQKVSRLPAK